MRGVRILTPLWALRVLGRWRWCAQGREWRVTYASVCELHDETAIGALVRIPGKSDEEALVNAAKWLVDKWPHLDDSPDDKPEIKERFTTALVRLLNGAKFSGFAWIQMAAFLELCEEFSPGLSEKIKEAIR